MALMGLDVTELKLKDDLYKIIKQAYKDQFTNSESQTDTFMENKINEAASKFAKSTAGPCAKAIHKFLLEMKIDATVSGTIIAPPMPPALPGGPCTGMIPAMNQIKVS